MASLIDSREMSTPLGYVIFMLMLAFAAILCVLCRRGSIKPGVAVCIICGCWIAEIMGNALYVMPGKTEVLSSDRCCKTRSVGDQYTIPWIQKMAPERALWFMRIMRHILRQTGIHPWQMEIRSERFPSMGLAHFDNVEYIYSGNYTAYSAHVQCQICAESGEWYLRRV